jgi:hypothetical protein
MASPNNDKLAVLIDSGSLDGFCLISSDSDFMRLATRIREAGLVCGRIRGKKNPLTFRGRMR